MNSDAAPPKRHFSLSLPTGTFSLLRAVYTARTCFADAFCSSTPLYMFLVDHITFSG
jgi:hypothetical protein